MGSVNVLPEVNRPKSLAFRTFLPFRPSHRPFIPVLPAFPVLPALAIIPLPGGDLASTGLMKELQRVQVQSPGKTVWNDSTANTNLAMAA